MAIIKKREQKITSVGKEVENLESLCTAGGNVKWGSVMQNSVVVPQKIKSRLPYDSATPLLDIYPRIEKICVQSC